MSKVQRCYAKRNDVNIQSHIQFLSFLSLFAIGVFFFTHHSFASDRRMRIVKTKEEVTALPRRLHCRRCYYCYCVVCFDSLSLFVRTLVSERVNGLVKWIPRTTWLKWERKCSCGNFVVSLKSITFETHDQFGLENKSAKCDLVSEISRKKNWRSVVFYFFNFGGFTILTF